MSRLIVKSPYIDCGKSTKKAGGFMKYIATRDGVQMLPDDRPATKKQEMLIGSITKDFPETKELFEYEDWERANTKANASAFIGTALEMNRDKLGQSDVYMRYIATRPRVERLGSHGLFGDENSVNLEQAMTELENYTGKVWTHILSLRREDATRLGYENADSWRSLLRSHRNEIAEAMHVPPGNFRWYAAFHDEGEHPHVHMMAWSSDPTQGYLDQYGISSIRSKLTNDIFQHEMLHLYEQKGVSRDELAQEVRQVMAELVNEMKQNICDHPEIERLMLQLSNQLETVKGKKQYGYLPKPVKATVDEIVNQLEKLPAVSECYKRWQELQGQVQGYYTNEAPEPLPLSQQKEFRAIKNAVIKEAERLRHGEITFEDDSIIEPDEPENGYLASQQYLRVKEELGENYYFEYRDAAAEEMLEMARQDSPYAQHAMGKLYRDGGLLIPDIQKAKYWFGQAAVQGIATSQYALGKLLLSDDHEVRDPELGLAWMEFAFESGNQYAGYRLGKEYLRGEIVEKDVQQALSYLTPAAEQGHQQAQYMLGKLYLEGKEVEQDISQAQYWLDLSAQQGNEYASFFLQRMNDGIPTPSLISAATRLMHHMSNIFQDNIPQSAQPAGMRVEHKLRQKLRVKKLGLGIKEEHSNEQEQQFMGY